MLDPGKYRLLGARYEAWARTLVDVGGAVRTDGEPWAEGVPNYGVTRTEAVAMLEIAVPVAPATKARLT